MYERFHVSHPVDDDVAFARDAVSDLNVGIMNTSAGADPGFQVRGGGALKKIAPSEFLGYFVWKIAILRQKILFFQF